jgi:hypothetical protein
MQIFFYLLLPGFSLLSGSGDASVCVCVCFEINFNAVSPARGQVAPKCVSLTLMVLDCGVVNFLLQGNDLVFFL